MKKMYRLTFVCHPCPLKFKTAPYYTYYTYHTYLTYLPPPLSHEKSGKAPHQSSEKLLPKAVVG